jgi:hypothetical protein
MSFKILLLTIFITPAIFASEMPLYNPADAKEKLGYDPKITIVRETDGTVINTGRKTICLHGFGDNGLGPIRAKQADGSARLPGDIVTFNFPDAVTERGMDTTKSSLGQWPDMQAALYVLNTMHDCGEKSIGINGHSRGGATAVNMIAALANQTDEYKEKFAALEIDAVKKAALLQMLQTGHVVLECPLTDVRSVIKHQVAKSSTGSSLTSWFGPWLASSSIRASAASVDYCASAVVRKYRPWQEQALESATKWQDAKIPTIVHFQKDGYRGDEVLGNEHDEEFMARLSASNGATHTRVHTGYDGGHNSSFASFAHPRNEFLSRHGAAYKPLETSGK